MKILKTILIIFASIVGVLAIAGIAAYFWAKGIWDKITFGKPIPTALDLKGISVADIANIILSGGEKTVNVTLSFPIKNDSDKDITISKFRMKLFYKDSQIAQTSDKLYAETTVIPANSTKNITDTVDINLNQFGGRLIVDKLTGKNPEIDYTIDINVFGLPVSKIYPIKDSFIL